MKKIALNKEKETLFITLLAKALDSQTKNSILHDTKAQELLTNVDYDFNKLFSPSNVLIVIRARILDDWVREFLGARPDSIVLNLGCGLDTRITRIHPSTKVRWFDVDYPEVIDVRKEFYKNKTGYTMVSSSVNDLGWLNKIPKDQPVLIIAEGLLEYLTEKEVQTLLHQLTTHFDKGEMIFDVMNSFAINSGKSELKRTTGATHQWAVDDIKDVDKLNTKLKRIETKTLLSSQYKNRVPWKLYLLFLGMNIIPPFNTMIRLLKYQF